jgi:transcriptional regulator GlxA family with amidase domain
MTKLPSPKLYTIEDRIDEEATSLYTKQECKKSDNAKKNALILNAARRLLTQSSLNINDVAKRCGFSSASYFIRTFHKTFGTTPAKYRKRLRG